MKITALLLLSLGLAGVAAAQTTIYDNTVTFTGFAYANGGAAADPANAANTITTLIADDIDTLYGGTLVTGFSFNVANFDTAPVTARPRVRFYAADGASGGPGTIVAGFTFNPIAFGASSVTTYSTAIASANYFAIPANGDLWAGITFDNNGGGTGATVAQLNNLGQGLFDPPAVGASADVFFQTTANGSFASNNPAGSFYNFGATGPKANFGWKFVTAVPEPASMATLAVGALALLRRRRKSA